MTHRAALPPDDAKQVTGSVRVGQEIVSGLPGIAAARHSEGHAAPCRGVMRGLQPLISENEQVLSLLKSAAHGVEVQRTKRRSKLQYRSDQYRCQVH